MLYVMLFCEYPFERAEDAGDPHRFQKVLQRLPSISSTCSLSFVWRHRKAFCIWLIKAGLQQATIPALKLQQQCKCSGRIHLATISLPCMHACLALRDAIINGLLYDHSEHRDHSGCPPFHFACGSTSYWVPAVGQVFIWYLKFCYHHRCFNKEDPQFLNGPAIMCRFWSASWQWTTTFPAASLSARTARTC